MKSAFVVAESAIWSASGCHDSCICIDFCVWYLPDSCNTLNQIEWSYFFRGGAVVGRSGCPQAENGPTIPAPPGHRYSWSEIQTRVCQWRPGQVCPNHFVTSRTCNGFTRKWWQMGGEFRFLRTHPETLSVSSSAPIVACHIFMQLISLMCAE